MAFEQIRMAFEARTHTQTVRTAGFVSQQNPYPPTTPLNNTPQRINTKEHQAPRDPELPVSNGW